MKKSFFNLENKSLKDSEAKSRELSKEALHVLKKTIQEIRSLNSQQSLSKEASKLPILPTSQEIASSILPKLNTKFFKPE